MRKTTFYNQSNISIKKEIFEYDKTNLIETRYLIRLPKEYIDKPYGLYVIFCDKDNNIDIYNWLNDLRPYLKCDEIEFHFERLPFKAFVTRSTYEAYELYYASPDFVSDFINAKIINGFVPFEFFNSLRLSIFEQALFNDLKLKNTSGDNLFTFLNNGKFRIWLEHHKKLDNYFELIKRVYENPFHSSKIDPITEDVIVDIYTHYFEEKQSDDHYLNNYKNIITL